jgi:hypothetical protein
MAALPVDPPDPKKKISIRDMAKAAADAICSKMPDPDVIIDHDTIERLGGFPAQPEDVAGFKKWSIWRITFRQEFCWLVGKRTGRWPQIEEGSGYRFPEPGEVAPYALEQTLDGVDRAVRKGRRILRTVRVNELDANDKLLAEGARLSLGMLGAAAKAERGKTQAQQDFLNAQRETRGGDK